MGSIRPTRMSQGELAELLKGAGFTACSKTAVSLAERSKETGVQFTQEARKTVRIALKSTSEGETAGARCAPLRREENRKNGRKTTVWLDDELRAWLETRAYMEDSCVGEVVRRIVAEARTKETKSTQFWMERIATSQAPRNDNEKAASGVGAPEAAGRKDRR